MGPFFRSCFPRCPMSACWQIAVGGQAMGSSPPSSVPKTLWIACSQPKPAPHVRFLRIGSPSTDAICVLLSRGLNGHKPDSQPFLAGRVTAVANFASRLSACLGTGLCALRSCLLLAGKHRLENVLPRPPRSRRTDWRSCAIAACLLTACALPLPQQKLHSSAYAPPRIICITTLSFP